MPWRGPEYPGEFPSLGYMVADFIEAHCAIPDGIHAGEPFTLTDEQLAFLVWHYRLHPGVDLDYEHPSRAFAYDGSQLVRPQKWGKGPLASAIICAEAAGPALFAGWDAHGEPVGRPWPTPWIQVTAVSEDQTDNIWRALLPMIEMGDFGADLADTGETRINLPGDGRIEPVTASARSRLGQRITHAAQDETHSWLKRNGGRLLADNQRRNLAGVGGRWIEYTNGWDPAEQSVAQQTYEAPVETIHRDFPQSPASWSYKNKRDRAKIHRFAYRGAPWVDLERIESEAQTLLPRDPGQAERFFGNRIVSGADAAFDPDLWLRLAAPSIRVGLAKKTLATVGFDGARFHDSTGFVVTAVELGHQFPAGVWERPADVTDDDWEVPEFGAGGVDEAIEQIFDEWDVWRVYADPPYWESAIDRWRGRWGDQVVIAWWTNRTKTMALALKAYENAMLSGELNHDGDEALARHIANARKLQTRIRDDDDGRFLWVIRKERHDSPLKIDLAMAGCLSWEARGDAIAAGALTKKKVSRTFGSR